MLSDDPSLRLLLLVDAEELDDGVQFDEEVVEVC